MAPRARGDGGWTLRRDERTGTWTVRFRHAGKRWHRSTGESDRRAAQVEASRIYAEAVSGRRASVAGSRARLSDLLGAWISDQSAHLSPPMIEALEMYAAVHWLPFFGESLAGVTEASIADYVRARLRRVKAATVRKELSGLRGFVRWARDAGHLPAPILVPSVGRRVTGTVTATAPRRVDLSPEQVEAILLHLPETTKAERGDRGGLPRRPRDWYTLAWETGLRHGTIARLSVPEHYRPGEARLRISADIDKSRYQRDVPLTPRARQALDRCVSGPGFVFGPYRGRATLQKAARAAGIADWSRVSDHDIRHAAVTHMASVSTSVAGIAYLAGHRDLTTTARYVHAAASAAEQVLEARGTSPGTRDGTPPNRRAAKRRCEKGDLNPHALSGTGT